MKKIFVTVSIILTTIYLFAQTNNKQKGKALYEQYCLTCHQADGAGVPHLNPPLINTSFVKGDKAKLIHWVLTGSGDEKVEIEGKFYSNNMPAQNYLKDDEIAAILSYVRSSFGNKYSAVTPAEVKAVRATLK